MGVPTLKIVADVPVEIKEVAKRLAEKRGMTIKNLIVKLLKDAAHKEREKILEESAY